MQRPIIYAKSVISNGMTLISSTILNYATEKLLNLFKEDVEKQAAIEELNTTIHELMAKYLKSTKNLRLREASKQ